MRLGLLFLSLPLSRVECKSVNDEGNSKWWLKHVIFSMLMMICLVMYKKNKNRIAAAYMLWYFDDQVGDFLF